MFKIIPLPAKPPAGSSQYKKQVLQNRSKDCGAVVGVCGRGRGGRRGRGKRVRGHSIFGSMFVLSTTTTTTDTCFSFRLASSRFVPFCLVSSRRPYRSGRRRRRRLLRRLPPCLRPRRHLPPPHLLRRRRRRRRRLLLRGYPGPCRRRTSPAGRRRGRPAAPASRARLPRPGSRSPAPPRCCYCCFPCCCYCCCRRPRPRPGSG